MWRHIMGSHCGNCRPCWEGGTSKAKWLQRLWVFSAFRGFATKLDVFVHATLFLAWVDFIEHNICDGTHDERFGKI
jgi:hypothetical protein